MSAKAAYELSEALFSLRRKFDDYDQCGVMLPGEEVRALRAALGMAAMSARALEHWISRSNWTTEGRRERLLEERMLAEMARPGTNVLPFPGFFEEVPFSDGLPGGAA